MYATSDLAYSLGVLNRFCNYLRPVHVELVKHVLQHVSKTVDLGLKFDKETDIPNNIVRYVNSNFAWSKTDYKSTEDYIFMLLGAAISHLSKLQSTVVLSSCEIDYVAIC